MVIANIYGSGILHALSHVHLATTPGGSCYYYPHFTDKDTKVGEMK